MATLMRDKEMAGEATMPKYTKNDRGKEILAHITLLP
jgi:hypothetical protein